jgi:hypothetical protein
VMIGSGDRPRRDADALLFRRTRRIRPALKDGPNGLLERAGGDGSFPGTGRCEPRCVSLAM